MSKQLRLFEFTGFDILAKLKKESQERKQVNYHWNGEPW